MVQPHTVDGRGTWIEERAQQRAAKDAGELVGCVFDKVNLDVVMELRCQLLVGLMWPQKQEPGGSQMTSIYSDHVAKRESTALLDTHHDPPKSAIAPGPDTDELLGGAILS